MDVIHSKVKNMVQTSPSPNQNKWDISHLQDHLQYAIDLEFWTIPFYMSVMYSIKDPSHWVYRLIQSVVYQEMLHVELACNVANAYGVSPKFSVPVYQDQTIPHLNFSIDKPDPRREYSPYTAKIGPLDLAHINAMCLIEYPEWDTHKKPDMQEDVTQYGSIGEFYDAVEFGAAQLVYNINAHRNQVNKFQNFYNKFKYPTITTDGGEGLSQALNLIRAITDQGEGKTEGDVALPQQYQNTADGFEESWSHFTKFSAILDSQDMPEIYPYNDPPDNERGLEAQQILINNFSEFTSVLEQLFSGQDPDNFATVMATLGGNILNCWKNGAVPKFYEDQQPYKEESK